MMGKPYRAVQRLNAVRVHRIVLSVLALFWAGSELLNAQVRQSVGRLEEVRILGNRRISEDTIRFYIQSRQGDVYNEGQILRDYRSLLNTNFFVDAKVKKLDGETGTIVLFEVKERPLIRTIEYEGMKSFKESDVLEQFRELKVGMTVDNPFDGAKLPKARRALRTLLDTNGRPLGRVEVTVEPITSSAVKVVFNIDEGPKVRIGKIQFEGNTIFSDKELRGGLELTKERGPITLFKGLDKYIKEKVEHDLHVNMMDKYRERGYMEARLGEPKVEIVEAGRGILFGFRKTKQQYFITVPIDEGPQFRFGDFKLEGIKNFDSEVLTRAYNIQKGEVFNWVQLQKANEDLKKLYARYGYLDMEAIPEIDKNENENVMNVAIRVEEGKQYLVKRINFLGNTKTRDKVLRREFLLEEQRQFNGDLLDISVIRLNQLGFFDKIEEEDYEVVKRPDLAEVDVLVTVKEQSQQSIGLTGGVSGISGKFIGISYSTNNFRGLGQQIYVQAVTGTRTQQYNFSFQEPYFLDTRLSLGFSVFSQRFRYDTFTAFWGLFLPENNVNLFTRNSTGFSVQTAYPLWRWVRVGLSYQLQRISITDVADNFSDFALSQLTGFTPGGSREDAQSGIIRSEVTPSWTYNSKNAFFGATRGTMLRLSVPFAGGPLGGTYNVISPILEYQKFMEDRWLSGGRNSMGFRAQLLHLYPYGELPNGGPMTVPFFERIYRGGEFDFRGFDLRSVTPWAKTRSPLRDESGNPIIDRRTGLPALSENLVPAGGDTSLLLTAEYRIPVAGPIHLAAFADFGINTVLNRNKLVLFGPNTAIDLLENTNDVWRMSTGMEFQFVMPMLNQPFRLIFAYNPLVMDTTVTVNGIRYPMQERRRNIRFTVGYTF